MRRLLLTIALAGLLGGCSLLPSFGDVDEPGEKLAVAKGLYLTTLQAATAAAQRGALSDDMIVNKLEPARRAARTAIDAAETISKDAVGYADIVGAALDAAQDYLKLWKEIRNASARVTDDLFAGASESRWHRQGNLRHDSASLGRGARSFA